MKSLKSASAQWFVERMGLAAETDGLPRIAGRLFGTLLLSAEPLSLDALTRILGVSKASVSTDARRLMTSGVVERVSRPGDRRDYYQMTPDFFVRLVRHRISRWTALRELAADMRRRSVTLDPEVEKRFDQLESLHELVRARVDEALAEWAAGQHVETTAAGAGPRADA